jgi:hypothetical protein
MNAVPNDLRKTEQKAHAGLEARLTQEAKASLERLARHAAAP